MGNLLINVKTTEGIVWYGLTCSESSFVKSNQSYCGILFCAADRLVQQCQ